MKEVLQLARLYEFGISIPVLARECHCSPASIQNYITGRTLPTGTKQMAIKDGINHILTILTQIIKE